MTSPNEALLQLARRIIAGESASEDHAVARAGAATLHKLAVPFGRLIGAAGFRAIVSRSLHLTKLELSAFKSVQLDDRGTLDLGRLAVDDLELAAFIEALLANTLGLLVTFIGEELTLRFVHDVWSELLSTVGTKEKE
jgi:hypothetical protein